MQIITVNMLLHMAANTSWSWGYICSLKTIFCSMHSFGAKCTWTQMFCWKTRSSYLSHRSLGLHCHEEGRDHLAWNQLGAADEKYDGSFCISNYVEFKTLEGRRRCCSVCQPGEVSHCSPRRTDWTSLVSDAILVKLWAVWTCRLLWAPNILRHATS